jgi:hypothetical protein
LPEVPQPLLSKPNWQKPVESQHPLQVVELHGSFAGPHAGAKDASAPSTAPKKKVLDSFMARILGPSARVAKALRSPEFAW